MARRRVPGTFRTVHLFGVHTNGFAVPYGGVTTGLISGLSPTTRVVKTYGTFMGSGNMVAKCVASNIKFIGGLRVGNMSMGSGGVIMLNTNKTTATVRIRLTLSKTGRIGVFGIGSGFCRETRKAGTGLTRGYPSYIIAMSSLTSGTGLRRRVGAYSVLVGAAVVKVGPRRSMALISGSLFHGSLIITSAMCGPRGAGVVLRTRRTKYGTVINTKVLLRRNTIGCRLFIKGRVPLTRCRRFRGTRNGWLCSRGRGSKVETGGCL